MSHALVAPRQTPALATLSFEERRGLLVDRASTAREKRRLRTRLRQAHLRQTAGLDDLDYRPPRGLAKALSARLATCQWGRAPPNVLLTGPTGIGKTWLGWAWGHQACRDGLTALYLRLPRCLQQRPIAKGARRYGTLRPTRAKTDWLILNDWGLAPFSDEHRRDWLESVEARHHGRATLVTSQVPVAHWHEALGEPTLADASLARLVPHADKMTLQGESMRKRAVRLPRGATAA